MVLLSLGRHSSLIYIINYMLYTTDGLSITLCVFPIIELRFNEYAKTI